MAARCGGAVIAVVLFAQVANAQEQLNPQLCFGNDQYAIQRWNNLVVPCFRDNHSNRCGDAFGFARGKCATRLRLQMARISYNNRDAYNAYNTASVIAQDEPNEPDAWIIIGLSIDGALASPYEKFVVLKNALSKLNTLSLTPEQAGHRDAIAQRVAAVEAKDAQARAEAEARSQAVNQEVAAAAKKACGWFCSDIDRLYYEFCYRKQLEEQVDRSVADRWCACSAKFYKNRMSADQFAMFVLKVNGSPEAAATIREKYGRGHAERSGGAQFKWLDNVNDDFELMTIAVQAQLACTGK